MRKPATKAELSRLARVKQLPGEEWRPLPGYEGRYEVSSLGRARSMDWPWPNGRKGKILALARKITPPGYLCFSVYGDGKEKQFYLQRAICLAFHGPRPEGMIACHNNGNVLDCRAVNLRWDTHAGNAADRKLHGTHREGSAIRWHKLSEENVLEIRAGTEPSSFYAEKFGVSISVVHSARTKRTWKHLP